MKKVLLLLLFVSGFVQCAQHNQPYKAVAVTNDLLKELETIAKTSSMIAATELMRRKALAKIWFDVRNTHKKKARLNAVNKVAYWAAQYLHRANKNDIHGLAPAVLGSEKKLTIADVPVLTSSDIIEIGYDLTVNHLIQPDELASFKWDKEISNESLVQVITKSFAKKKLYDLLSYYAHKHDLPQLLSDNEWAQNAQTLLAAHVPIVSHVASDACVDFALYAVNRYFLPMSNYLITSTTQTT